MYGRRDDFKLISVKIIGNILLVVYETGASSNLSLYIWGLIVSQLGLLGLLIAGVAFIRKWYVPV